MNKQITKINEIFQEQAFHLPQYTWDIKALSHYSTSPYNLCASLHHAKGLGPWKSITQGKFQFLNVSFVSHKHINLGVQVFNNQRELNDIRCKILILCKGNTSSDKTR